MSYWAIHKRMEWVNWGLGSNFPFPVTFSAGFLVMRFKFPNNPELR